MKNKVFLSFIFIIAVFLAAAAFFWFQAREKEAAPATELPISAALAPEVEAVLSQKISLIAHMVDNAQLRAEVLKSNEKSKNLSIDEILNLDKRWRESEKGDEFVTSFLTNAAALELLKFQEDNPGFPEIFVTDVYGLNVGQTNKTTDFYQADEEWWVDAYNAGRGKSFHGPIEFDESAQAEAIAVYVPIQDPETGVVVGVAKAIVDIAAIKAEL